MSIQAASLRMALIVLSVAQTLCPSVIEGADKGPEDASECVQRFMALHDRLHENWSVYGRCSVLETMAFSPGEMRSEWFEAWGASGRKRLRYRHCVRTYEGVNFFSPTTIDSVLHIDGKRRYTSSLSTKPLYLVSISDEQLDAMGAKNRSLDDIFNSGKFPAPDLIDAVFLPGGSAIEQNRQEDVLERLFVLNYRCTFSQKLENGDIVGVWTSRKQSPVECAFRVVFGKDCGYYPKLTQGFYLKEPVPDDEDIDEKKAKSWFESRTKWKKQKNLGSPRKGDFVELQILAVWQPFKFDDVKVSFNDAGKVVTENGFEKLQQQLAERYAKEHGE